VEIYDVLNNEPTLIGRYCGNQVTTLLARCNV